MVNLITYELLYSGLLNPNQDTIISWCIFTSFTSSVIEAVNPNIIIKIEGCSFLHNSGSPQSSEVYQINISAKLCHINTCVFHRVGEYFDYGSFRLSGNESYLYQLSFDIFRSKTQHYAFYLRTNEAQLSFSNFTKSYIKFDILPFFETSGPKSFSKYCNVANCSGYRSIFRISIVPYEKWNIVDCSGEYIFALWDADIKLVEVYFRTISISEGLVYNYVRRISFERCTIINSPTLSISSNVIVGTLYTNGKSHEIPYVEIRSLCGSPGRSHSTFTPVLVLLYILKE